MGSASVGKGARRTPCAGGRIVKFRAGGSAAVVTNSPHDEELAVGQEGGGVGVASVFSSLEISASILLNLF